MFDDLTESELAALRDHLAAIAAGVPSDMAVYAVRETLARLGGDAVPFDDPAEDAPLLLALLDAAGDDPLGAAVREAVAADADTVEIAGDVLRALALAPGWPVADAIDAEAGSIEVARAHDPGALPIAEAVRAFAGEVDVRDAVDAALRAGAEHPDMALSAMLDRALPGPAHAAAAARLARDPAARVQLAAWADLGRSLRHAVEAAGEVSVWPEVARAIGLDDPDAVPGWDETRLARTIAAEAGTIDVAADVMGRIRRDLAHDVPEIPEPVNGVQGWAVVLVGLAAALVLAVVLPQWLASTGPSSDFVAQPVRFATADEISVDRIATGDASVFVEVPDEADAPLIIWVDDGGSL